MMTTQTLTDYVDQKGSIASGLSCIDPLGNERRVGLAVHAPYIGPRHEQPRNKNKFSESADECNAKLTPPSEDIFTTVS